MDGALGHSDKIAGMVGVNRHPERLRVGEPNVLSRKPHDAARDIQRILARFKHPREPIDGRVGIGIAH